MTTPYQALLRVFETENQDPPTAEHAARLALKLLHQAGFTVVPIEPTKAIKKAIHLAIIKDRGGSAPVWHDAVKAATGQ